MVNHEGPNFLYMNYTTQLISHEQATHLGHLLEHVLCQIIRKPHMTVKDIHLLSDEATRCIWKWNMESTPLQPVSVYRAIEHRCTQKGDDVAIAAWDGNLTYKELLQLASNLSHDLIKLGVGPETFVPLLFSKSKWAVVSVLAVIMSEAAYTFLDPSHPVTRLKYICDDLQADVALTSPGPANDLGKRLTRHAIAVSDEWLDFKTQQQQRSKDPAIKDMEKKYRPENPLYVVFTSGSTGKPKGLVMESGSFDAAAKNNVPAIGLNERCRVLQFANYTYDVANRDILFTLMHGGCICIPSESDRLNNLTGFMNEYQVNWASLTPTVAELLRPERLPHLKHLIIGGEAMTQKILSVWAGKLHLMNGYGPAECAALSCLRTDVEPDSDPCRIGYSLGCGLWILDSLDGNKLAPIGAVGELVIESDSVSRGYLGSAKTANAAFMSYFPAVSPTRTVPRRFYKTGDLAQFNSDGSLVFVGRKDTQVKIRGHRIELKEIEYQARACVKFLSPAPSDFHVEAISDPTNDSVSLVVLCSFVDISEEHVGFILAPTDAQIQSSLEKLLSGMSTRLPSYMVPGHAIPVGGFPVTTSGKIDRKRICEGVLQFLKGRQRKKTENMPDRPTSAVEVLLQSLWSQVLQLDGEAIGRDDHFIRCGGDSIKAIILVSLVHSAGLSLTVSDVLLHPRLADMASTAKEIDQEDVSPEETQNFFPDQKARTKALETAMSQCNISNEQIEDIYPTTAMQAGLIALASKTPGAYMEHFVYDFIGEVDVHRFQEAWKAVASANPILRTRVVATSSQLYQVVLREDVPCDVLSSPILSKYEIQDIQSILGQRLLRVKLVRCLDEEPLKTYFYLDIHHTLYDGWSLPRLIQQLEWAYRGQALKIRRFSPFIDYALKSIPAAENFWKARLAGAMAPVFPKLPSATYMPSPASKSENSIELMGSMGHGDTTISAMLRLAWAIVIAQQTNAGEVAFGVISTGRAVPVPGVTDMTGPTIAIVPLLLRLDSHLKVREMLQKVQEDASVTAAFEQLGLQRISKLGNDVAEVCRFQSALLVDMEDSDVDHNLFRKSKLYKANPFAASTYAINVACKISPGLIRVLATFDENVISQVHMNALMQRFVHAVQQLSNQPDVAIRDLSIIRPEELSQLQIWNGENPKAANSCIHDFIQHKYLHHHGAPVVCAWDGEMTYSQLDELSSRLATHLMRMEVGPECFVPICLERSKWTTVAMLGVLKSGGAFVLLDTALPKHRLQIICDSVNANFIISSTQNDALAASLVPHVIWLDDERSKWADGIAEDSKLKRSSVSPQNVAYAVFTSGSTGKPKGVVITHSAFVSSAIAHGSALCLSRETRIYQFASYAFDMCIGEHLSVLIHGGCICVPSTADARSSLVLSFNTLRANTIALTPSLARTLDPSELNDVKVLILGGEAPQKAEIQLWTAHARVMITYGPAECAVASSVLADVDPSTDFRLLGAPTGCVYWIVDPENHHRLSPIGLIGEILIEGPILGRGYLDEPEKTAAAWIEAPAWLGMLRQNDSPATILYKTGDLGHYDNNGLVRFSGRKDNQVKLRGQRVELAEVEHHVHHAFANVRDVVAEVVIPRDAHRPILVAFVYPETMDREIDPSKDFLAPPSAEFCDVVRRVKSDLAKRVPSYMIPALILRLLRLPRTHNGKLDSRMLRDKICLMPRETLQLYSEGVTSLTKRGPTTEEGQLIQSSWAQVLNMEIEDIGVDDEFVNLGGDSITAMQVVARLRKQGVRLTTADLMTSGSIDSLVENVNTAPASDVLETVEIVDEWFELSPMQRFFFETMTVDINHQAQKFLIGVSKTKPLNPHELELALTTLVERHPMLRAQFSQRDGQWVQRTQENRQGQFRFHNHDVNSLASVQEIVSRSQRSLDVRKGLVFSVDLITFDGRHYLFMVAHYLVIDLFSWRILWHELEDLVTGESTLGRTPFPFQQWCAIQKEYAHIHLEPDVIVPKIPDVPRDYWGIIGKNTFESAHQPSFTLDEDITFNLLQTARDTFKASPTDLIHAILLHSFVQVFHDRQPPTVFTGSHGRCPSRPDIDLSSTVGWFVSLCPNHVKATSRDSIAEIIQGIQDWHSKCLRNGVDLFASQLLKPRGREWFKGVSPIEIMFNYTGVYQQLENPHSLLQAIPEMESSYYGTPPELQRFALINASAAIEFNRLKFNIVYNGHMNHQDKLVEWVRAFEQSLRQSIATCTR